MSIKTHLMSIQPYFVLDAENFCQRILLQNGISHFYSFCNLSSNDINVKLFVDGCWNIIFEYKDENGIRSLRTHLVGSTVEPRTFCLRKDCEYFCVRFQPGAESFIKEIKIKDTVGKIIIIDQLESMKNMCRLMKEQNNFDSRMQTFIDYYSKKKDDLKRKNSSELFKQITELIIQRRGMVKISELEKLSGYTSRYINHIFDTEFGISAKQLCSSIKFQFLLNDLNKNETSTLTRISSEYKFYDQSHFIHEFKNCTGTTPSEYTEEVIKKNYRENILTL